MHGSQTCVLTTSSVAAFSELFGFLTKRLEHDRIDTSLSAEMRRITPCSSFKENLGRTLLSQFSTKTPDQSSRITKFPAISLDTLCNVHRLCLSPIPEHVYGTASCLSQLSCLIIHLPSRVDSLDNSDGFTYSQTICRFFDAPSLQVIVIDWDAFATPKIVCDENYARRADLHEPVTRHTRYFVFFFRNFVTDQEQTPKVDEHVEPNSRRTERKYLVSNGKALQSRQRVMVFWILEFRSQRQMW